MVDTHAWIWWLANPDKLSDAARVRIDDAAEIGVCAISCWEVAMLVSRDRLRFDRDVSVWIGEALKQPRVQLVPLTPEVAVAATRLPADIPRDPADRMIVATAGLLGADLVTRDRALRDCVHVRTVW